MRGTDRQPECICGEDRAHGHQFGGSALTIGEVGLADLLADGNQDCDYGIIGQVAQAAWLVEWMIAFDQAGISCVAYRHNQIPSG